MRDQAEQQQRIPRAHAKLPRSSVAGIHHRSQIQPSFEHHCARGRPKKPRLIEQKPRFLWASILTSMNILALDVGTSAVKAAVVDAATSVPVGGIAHAS